MYKNTIRPPKLPPKRQNSPQNSPKLPPDEVFLRRAFLLPYLCRRIPKGTKPQRGSRPFIETLLEQAARRNPHVFCGEFITVTRWADGSLHPNFRPTKIGGRGFTPESYAWGVACELREALKGLIEEDMSE